jgi:hypothetical protein
MFKFQLNLLKTKLAGMFLEWFIAKFFLNQVYQKTTGGKNVS